MPWEIHAAALAQLLPVLGGLRFGSSLPAVRRWFMLWCALSFGMDALQFVSAQLSGNNLWQVLLSRHVLAAVMLWVLILMQTEPSPRRVLRWALFFLVPATVVLTLLTEGPSTFGDKSGPILQLTLLAGCVYTLVSRSVSNAERLLSQDWFWITMGASLYFAVGVALGPVATALLPSDQSLLVQVFVFKARADVLAFVLMTVGMLCPLPRSLSLKPT